MIIYLPVTDSVEQSLFNKIEFETVEDMKNFIILKGKGNISHEDILINLEDKFWYLGYDWINVFIKWHKGAVHRIPQRVGVFAYKTLVDELNEQIIAERKLRHGI